MSSEASHASSGEGQCFQARYAVSSFERLVASSSRSAQVPLIIGSPLDAAATLQKQNSRCREAEVFERRRHHLRMMCSLVRQEMSLDSE
jgi:hypothetical protein